MNKKKLKKILCYNILNNKKCNYGNKCLYAHGLAEQKIEPLRHKVYTIIKNTDNLNNINLINDNNLFDTILQLTKVCTMCNKNICSGGYNCKNGAISNKYKICYDDLIFGNCKRVTCGSVHLTKKGLIPYNVQKFKNTKKIQNKVNMNNDILLSDKFLLSYFKKKDIEIDDLCSNPEEEENVKEIIKYLNTSESDSEDESIFVT